MSVIDYFRIPQVIALFEFAQLNNFGNHAYCAREYAFGKVIT